MGQGLRGRRPWSGSAGTGRGCTDCGRASQHRRVNVISGRSARRLRHRLLWITPWPPVARRIGGRVTWVNSQWKLCPEPGHVLVEINTLRCINFESGPKLYACSHNDNGHDCRLPCRSRSHLSVEKFRGAYSSPDDVRRQGEGVVPAVHPRNMRPRPQSIQFVYKALR